MSRLSSNGRADGSGGMTGKWGGGRTGLRASGSPLPGHGREGSQLVHMGINWRLPFSLGASAPSCLDWTGGGYIVSTMVWRAMKLYRSIETERFLTGVNFVPCPRRVSRYTVTGGVYWNPDKRAGCIVRRIGERHITGMKVISVVLGWGAG